MKTCLSLDHERSLSAKYLCSFEEVDHTFCAHPLEKVTQCHEHPRPSCTRGTMDHDGSAAPHFASHVFHLTDEVYELLSARRKLASRVEPVDELEVVYDSRLTVLENLKYFF